MPNHKDLAGDDLHAPGYSLYPNPTFETLHVTGASTSDGQIIQRGALSDAEADSLSVPHGSIQRNYVGLASAGAGFPFYWSDILHPDQTISGAKAPPSFLDFKTSGGGTWFYLGGFADDAFGDLSQALSNSVYFEWYDRDGDGQIAAMDIGLYSPGHSFDIVANNEFGRLGINTFSPQATLHVAGDGLYEGNLHVLGAITPDGGLSREESATTNTAFPSNPVLETVPFLHQAMTVHYGPLYLPDVFPSGATNQIDNYFSWAEGGAAQWQLTTTTDLQPGNTNSSANGGVAFQLIGQGTAGGQMGDVIFAVWHVSEAEAAAADGYLPRAAASAFPNSYWEWGITPDDSFNIRGGANFNGLQIDAVSNVLTANAGLVDEGDLHVLGASTFDGVIDLKAGDTSIQLLRSQPVAGGTPWLGVAPNPAGPSDQLGLFAVLGRYTNVDAPNYTWAQIMIGGLLPTAPNDVSQAWGWLWGTDNYLPPYNGECYLYRPDSTLVLEFNGGGDYLGIHPASVVFSGNYVSFLGANIGFYGTNPVVQQTLATGAGHTSDNIIAALQALGLVKQS